MYYDYTVSIPSLPGKIITKKSGNSTYVLYQYAQRYNAAKQITVPKRTIIGKCLESDNLLMFPNERFADFFPEEAEVAALPVVSRSCALRIGTYAVLHKMMKDEHLSNKLKKWFPDHSDLMQDLISFCVIEATNDGIYYYDYAYTHPLFTVDMLIYSDQEISKAVKSITKKKMDGFLAEWKKDEGVFGPNMAISKAFIEVEMIGSPSKTYRSGQDFISMIALSYCSRMIRALWKSKLYPKNMPKIEMLSNAVRELERIEMARRSQGKYQLDHAISERQAAILSAFELTPMDVRNIAAEIGVALTPKQVFVKKE